MQVGRVAHGYTPKGNPTVRVGLLSTVPETIDVCPAAELAPGEVRVVEWEDLEIGVFNCAGELLAIEDRCSHDNGDARRGRRSTRTPAPSNAPATARSSTSGRASR